MSSSKERNDEGWIENTGKQPVEDDVLVDVKWNDGSIDIKESADEWFWTLDASLKLKITHWRLSEKDNSISDNTVSIDELVYDVQASLPEPVRLVPDSNPKKQFGDKSLPLNLWPALASAYGCLGLFNGKSKYGMSNFNATPVEASIYIAGAMRHLSAWAEGEEFDPADGVPNLGGVLANIAILLEARAAGTLIDDRKLGTGYLKERDALKEIVAHLQELHKDKNPRHYTIQDAK